MTIESETQAVKIMFQDMDLDLVLYDAQICLV